MKLFRIFYLKNILLASEMAGLGNQHCANCIGTRSFPIRLATILETKVHLED